mmetsp:Transcript_4892/g.11595  ORF Transcript_4892/g.11595 Transcript_4892/m.11595 type:complete len:88 (-) Transcript_4892:126-389(-)
MTWNELTASKLIIRLPRKAKYSILVMFHCLNFYLSPQGDFSPWKCSVLTILLQVDRSELNDWIVLSLSMTQIPLCDRATASLLSASQ